MTIHWWPKKKRPSKKYMAAWIESYTVKPPVVAPPVVAPPEKIKSVDNKPGNGQTRQDYRTKESTREIKSVSV